MKTLFTLLLVTLFSCHLAFAQHEQPVSTAFKPVRTAGIKVGINFASVSNLAESDVYMGVHAGFFGNVQTSEGVGFGGELNYSHQGVTASNLDVGLNYLSIPMLVNLYSGPVTFQGGIYGAYLFSANLKNGQAKGDISGYLRDTDYGLLVGINLNPLGATFVYARFNLGLKNINKQLITPAHVELYNRNIQLGLGYRF
ncbi:porin family protein [Adhaeribacter soli]|uniref:porin family protein n=1 Tax=Adhaeribacter soli TaxID=2607655 RepID=UPI00178280A7|nr:porin family protein [Adhaeribacter soli]